MEPPYEPHPRKLCPDPELGTREAWRWCADCGGVKPPEHVHGDPLEALTYAELLELARTPAR